MADMKITLENERLYHMGYDTGYADGIQEKDASTDKAYKRGYEDGFDDGFRASYSEVNKPVSPDEMIIDGMKRIREGCAGRQYCDTCPFAQWCDYCPEEWSFEV